jgi:hypothetical protein
MAYVFNPITGKLDLVGSGDAQVNSDWNAASGVAQILNKPTIQTFDQSLNTVDLATFSALRVNGAYFELRREDPDNPGNFFGLFEVYSNGATFYADVTAPNLVTKTGVETLTNKSISAPQINSGTLSDSRLSANVPLKDTANTFTTDQTFSGTANTAPNQTAASGSSLMTRDLVDQRMIFGGPYLSNLASLNWNQTLGTGGATTNNGNFFAVGNSSTPTAGVTSAILNTPNTGYQFISPDNGIGAVNATAGNGGVINFTHPFALGFFIEIRNGPTNALDVISRVCMGNSLVTSAVMGGVNNGPGFGVRISKATATTYDVAIYARTIASTNTNISGATNATPIVITNTGHNLQNGDLVEITGVVGNTAANGIYTVANRTASTFELAGSVGNGAYTSSGVANKISAPIQIQAGRVRRMFLYNRGNGTLELHLGSITNTPAITLTGMSVYSGTQVPSQSCGRIISQRSVTDTTPFAQTCISNLMLIQP